MKSLFVLVSILACIAIIFVSSEAFAVNPDNIVGMWLFEEDDKDEVIIDSSGNGHDGTLTGPPTKRETGKFGEAVSIEAGNFVLVPHSEDLSLTSFTVTVWISTEDKGRWSGIVSKAHNNQTRNYLMYMHMDKGTPAISIGDQAADSWHDLGGTTVVNDGLWHHVAISFDDDTNIGRVFVDGVQESQYNVANEVPLNDADLKFGASSHGGGNSYIGLMDEIAIFEVALEEADIKRVMLEGLGALIAFVEADGKLTTVWGEVKSSL